MAKWWKNRHEHLIRTAYAAEPEALQKGLAEKVREFVAKGAEVYSKA
jgi:hypothetical protein